MKKNSNTMLGRMVAAIAALIVSIAPAWGRSVSLDLRNTSTTAKRFAANHSGPAMSYVTDGILRSFDLDAGVADVGEVAVGDELTFTLFDDVTITLTLKVKAASPLGGDVFLAEASGYGGVKNAVVMRTADGLTIDVQDYHNAKMYKVISTASGVSVRELDASKTGTCGCESTSTGLTGLDADAKPHSATGGTINGAPVSRSANPAYVDILVAYDANAKVWAEANGGMLTFAQMAVQKMNTVLYNNALYTYSFRFRLVGITDVSVSSTSIDNATLEAVINGTGGWAPIKAKRNEVGADIVTVLIDTGSPYGTTGLGCTLDYDNYVANSFSELPYNICAIRSVAQSHTMTHEVGHNMGCGHAKNQRTDPGEGLFTSSNGYYYEFAGKWYHTIMAYNSECPYGDGTATQSPYFSDDWDYIDSETGLTFHPGEPQARNQATLYTTYTMASNWRESKGIDLESGYVADNVEWKRSRDEAFTKARSEGKKVFVVCGRDTCGNTQGTRENCNALAVKRILNQNFVCWYNKYDDERSQVSKYLSGFSIGNTYPFIAVIDVVNDRTLKAEGNYHYVQDLLDMLGDIPGVKHTLTRYPNGGTYKGSTGATTAANGLEVGTTAYCDIGIPTRSGYTFTGWFTAADGGEKVYGADGKCVAGTYWDSSKKYKYGGNLTVYAHWATAVKYTLTRNPNGGTYKGSTGATTATGGLEVGSTAYCDIGVPTRSGYTFTGWFTAASGGTKVYGADGKCVAGTAYWDSAKKYKYAGNLTVYAQWTAAATTKYTLTRYPNGGTYKGSTGATTAANGLEVGTTAYCDIGVPTRSGYTFTGWFTASSGGTKVYGADGKCVAGTAYWDSAKKYKYNGNLTVYAQWAGAKYTLTRNPNGGTYKGSTGATTAANGLEVGTTAYCDIGVPTRSGYTFTGWFTASSGGTKVYGTDGKCITGTSYWSSDKKYIYAGNLTVYAHWTATADPLAEALDNTLLTFRTGGDAKWSSQTAYASDGVDAARSGTIGHAQESWLETTVSGAGMVSFCWAVSSESGYDNLEFYIDDELISCINGEVLTWYIASSSVSGGGSHVLKWRYIKDGSVSKGLDAGFVDHITWTPASAQVIVPDGNQELNNGESEADAADESEPLPEWAVGRFDGVVTGADGGVAGTVTLTVSEDGEFSGKMMKDGLVRTLSAEGATFAIDESATFRRAVATGDGWVAWQNVWKDEPWKAVAEAFAEAPALAMPDGVTLRFSASGTVAATYGAYSCSAVLIPSASTRNSQLTTLNFSLFLYFPPRAGEFEGYAAEIPLVWDGEEFSTAVVKQDN